VVGEELERDDGKLRADYGHPAGQERIRRDDYALSSGRAISCLYVTVCVARHALRSRVSKSFSMVLRLSL
jgi:hypothetical protein